MDDIVERAGSQREESLAHQALRLRRRGDFDALRSLYLDQVRQGADGLRYFRRFLELAPELRIAPERLCVEGVAALADAPRALRGLLPLLRRGGASSALAQALERLAEAGESPLESLEEAASSHAAAGDAPGVDRCLQRLATVLEGSAAGLPVADYLRMLRALAPAAACASEPPRKAVLRALAASVVRGGDLDERQRVLMARVEAPEALEALLDALAGEGRDLRPWVDLYRARGRWEWVARVYRSQARGAADPLPDVLRAAEAHEKAGERDAADEIERQIGTEVQARGGSPARVPTLSTLMFRNLPLLDCMVCIAGWLVETASGRRPRLHVAACSTGEEVFSLALRLDEAGLLERVDLAASDVSGEAVAVARSGRLPRRVLVQVPERFRERFAAVDEDSVAIDREVLRHIAFSNWDLLADTREDRWDLLVANNLSVHLDAADSRRLVERLAAQVSADGCVVMGGDDHVEVLEALADCGLRPVTARLRECYEAWALQRHAWYTLPRPYWALPPCRPEVADPARFASVFARSDAVLAALQRRLDETTGGRVGA